MGKDENFNFVKHVQNHFIDTREIRDSNPVNLGLLRMIQPNPLRSQVKIVNYDAHGRAQERPPGVRISEEIEAKKLDFVKSYIKKNTNEMSKE